MRFKKNLVFFFTLFVMLLPFLTSISPVSACGGFAVFPPVGAVHLTEDDTNVMVVFDGKTQTFIMEPSYKGNAVEFGIVVPFPSRPTLRNVPDKLFSQLEELTYIPPSFGMADLGVSLGFAIPGSLGSSVQVIEKKKVGDFDTTILTADSSEALIKWLKDHSYQYKQEDEANFDYYIQKGGYYFVALKVNLDAVHVDSQGIIQEKLNPISFTFTTSAPVIPLRIEAGNMEQMMFNLYVLSTVPYYIPGSDIIFSQPVVLNDVETAPALLAYDGVNQWLIRQEVKFYPQQVLEDLILTQGNESLLISDHSTIKVNSQALPIRSGIISGKSMNERTIDSTRSKARSPVPILLEIRIISTLAIVLIGIIIVAIWNHIRIYIQRNPMKILKRLLLCIIGAVTSYVLAYVSFIFVLLLLHTFLNVNINLDPLAIITGIYFFFLINYFFWRKYGFRWHFVLFLFQTSIITAAYISYLSSTQNGLNYLYIAKLVFTL